ncbi:MAG: Wzz/FepE/Etk N-terminal domain-containing protein, partial [Planctomycetota bacterium]
MEDRLPDLTLLLRRRWRSLTLGTAVGIVLAVFYVIGAQPKYESEALILVEQRDAALPIGGAQAAAAAPVDYAELLETHAAICSSERIVTAAIVAAKLDELQGIRAILRASPETTATDYIIEQIEAQPGAGSRTVAHTLEVSFVHTDADEAAAVLEAIVEQYRKFTDTRLRADFNEARKLIEKANVELEAEIESLQGELSRLRDDAPLLYEGTEAVNPHVQSLLQLQTLVLTTEQEYLAMASKLAQVEEILANGGLDDATMVEALSIVGNEVVERMALLLEADRGNSLSLTFQQEDPLREQKASAEFNQLLDLFVEERQLLRTYGEKSLEVERIRAQIDRVSDFIKQKTELLTSESDEPDAGPAELAAAYARILRYDISALDKTLSELRDKVDEERRLAGVAARFAMNESFLGEELERRTRLFDVIVQNLENVNLIGDYGGIVVEPLSSIRPGIQVWPLPILLLPLG